MIWCPRCDQGWVIRARITGKDEIFFVCQECDNMWLDREPQPGPPFVNLELYLAKYGLDGPPWSYIETLEDSSST